MLCYEMKGKNKSLEKMGEEVIPWRPGGLGEYPGGDVDGSVGLAPSLRLAHTLPGVRAWELLVRGHVILGLGEF